MEGKRDGKDGAPELDPQMLATPRGDDPTLRGRGGARRRQAPRASGGGVRWRRAYDTQLSGAVRLAKGLSPCLSPRALYTTLRAASPGRDPHPGQQPAPWSTCARRTQGMRLDHIGRGRAKAICDRTAMRAQLRWHTSLPNRPLRTRRGCFPTKLDHSSTRVASLRDAWLAWHDACAGNVGGRPLREINSTIV